MKMDLRTQNQRLEDKLKEIEHKLDKILQMIETKESETKNKKVEK